MTRRALFRRLVSAAIGVALMRTLPGIAPVPTRTPARPRLTINRLGEFRYDVLYGHGIWNKDFAVRVQG